MGLEFIWYLAWEMGWVWFMVGFYPRKQQKLGIGFTSSTNCGGILVFLAGN